MGRYPSDVIVPSKGDIPIGMCLDSTFPFTSDINRTHLMWRLVEPTRQQDDFGPTEWVSVSWSMSLHLWKKMRVVFYSMEVMEPELYLMFHLPDTAVGKIQYKAKLGTTNGAFPFTYPASDTANYYELSIPYRAPFGSGIMALLMFAFIATMVWGGLGFTLRAMFDEEGGVIGLPDDQSHLIEEEDV